MKSILVRARYRSPECIDPELMCCLSEYLLPKCADMWIDLSTVREDAIYCELCGREHGIRKLVKIVQSDANNCGTFMLFDFIDIDEGEALPIPQ